MAFDARKLTMAVGAMSAAFGVFDLLFADRLAKKVGMKDANIFRAAGVREVVTGIGAIAAPASVIPLAARLVGDVADVGILGTLSAKKDNPRSKAALIGVGIVIAVAAIDIFAVLKQRTAPN